jgi:cellulose synthase/poly-beta-1,6-N-acetylglucosamine synthase-like glycosyltransferase
MFSPTVRVLIPAKNEESCIGACIKSILDSDYPKDKLGITVVIDDSKDRTLEICKKFEPKIEVVELGPKKCKAEALNEVLPRVDGEIVAVFDADCVVDNKCIREAVKHFSNQDVDGVSGAIKTCNKQKFLPRILSLETCFTSFLESVFSRFGANPHFSGKNFFLRKEVLDKIGRFDEQSFLEDVELSIRMKRLGHKVVFDPAAVTMQNEPEDFRSYVSQRKRWARGTFRIKKLKMQNSVKNGLSDLMHCIPYYMSPFSIIVLTFLFVTTWMNMHIILTLPLTALFLFSLFLVVYSRVFFKESLLDLVLIPFWLLLMNFYMFVIMPYAYMEEKRSFKMKW